MEPVHVGASGWVPLAHAGGADEVAATVLVLGALWSGWIASARLRGRGFDRITRPVAWGILGCAAALLVSAAFVPRLVWGPTAPASGPRPSSTAELAIDTPAPGATVAGPEVTVRIELQDATIVGGTSTTLRPREGHVHLLVDGDLIDMTYDGTPLRLGDLAPGTHRVEAEFVAADHAPFSPRIRASTTFVVAGEEEAS